jgi:hypothetical protein
VRTVAELIAKLSEFPGDLPVILSQDAEGNGFSPLSSLGHGYYDAENTWSGDFYPEPTGCDENCDDAGHDDFCGPPDTAVLAVFLRPTN